uniref:MIT_C domain-containing protein n=1 Tax=Gongylonema pulchrum TaxID=637853 RepID=A0A183D4P8_9BILA
LGVLFAEAEASDDLIGQRQFDLKLVKELRINDGDTGFSYNKIFVDGIDDQLETVVVDEPYMRVHEQMLVTRAKNLRRIVLCTQNDCLQEKLNQLRNDLITRHIVLTIKCSNSMHDREIRFDNGWTYRIGRGLNYFKRERHFTLGMTDYEFKKCFETVVCILREMRPKSRIESNES